MKGTEKKCLVNTLDKQLNINVCPYKRTSWCTQMHNMPHFYKKH